MKRLLLLLFLLATVPGAFAQEPAAASAPAGKKFFIGISYSYMSVDMKLSHLSLSSEWYGQDLGTDELSDERIDEINDYVSRETSVNAIGLELGMKMIDKPDVNWKLRGTLLLALAQNQTKITNDLTGVQEYKFNSGLSKPFGGLGFDFGYQFSKHWGLYLRPMVVGTFGTTTTIDDRVNDEMYNFNSYREDNFWTVYLRGSLFASYTAGPVTLFAGPGFYRLWSQHEYIREYTHIETGDVIREKAVSDIVPVSWIDASLGFSWQIVDRINFHGHAGFGGDLMIDAGINYGF